MLTRERLRRGTMDSICFQIWVTGGCAIFRSTAGFIGLQTSQMVKAIEKVDEDFIPFICLIPLLTFAS
jgi:hypothetical protein